MSSPRYSVIIPVYNRPYEVQELLESLTLQTYKNFEVILIEDGSTRTCEKVYEDYSGKLVLSYYFKPNSGPGPSRNYGFEKAKGKYLVVFDSDCVVPAQYFQTVEDFLQSEPLDAWGGPDRGRQDFTNLQQAMGFTMSSVLTTGGIRGGKQHGFQPRSFNMGISREVFAKTGGFKFDRFAEDIELSIRMRKNGFHIGLISEAFVYHKRRTTFSQFFNQVANFGKGRALVGKAHPGEIKVTHWFPAFFLVGLLLMPVVFLFFPLLGKIGVSCYLLYLFLISINCFLTTHSFAVAILSIPSALIQLVGYGTGFIKELFGSK